MCLNGFLVVLIPEGGFKTEPQLPVALLISVI